MKKLIATLITLTMLLALTACSGNGGTSSSSAPTTGTEKIAESMTSQSQEQVTITLVRTGTPEILHNIFDPIIENFEKEYPNIHVEMQDLGWADATQSLQTWAASETLPDVMYHLPATIFDLYEKGLILDLTDYVDNELKEDMYPAMLQAGQYEGKQLMITCNAASLIMWYNADLFRQAGLDPDAPPTTWQELLDACEVLSTLEGITPLGMYASPSGGETSFLFESLFTTEYGGSAWDSEKNQYVYDSEEGKQAAINTLQFLKDLTAYAQEGYVEYGRFDCRTLMRDGKVAIVLDAPNMANQVTDQLADGTIRAAAIPAGASGVSSTAINAGGWYIPTNCAHPQEAWTFLRYMMRTENQFAHETYGSVPITKSAAALYSDEYMLNIIKGMEHSYAEGICVQTNALWSVTGEQLQLLMMGDQSAETTWENLSSEHGEIYK